MERASKRPHTHDIHGLIRSSHKLPRAYGVTNNGNFRTSIPECVLANEQLPDVLETENLFTFQTLEILCSSSLVLPYIFI